MATLDWLLSLEADRMVNANIARSDLDSEMTVVRNEMEIAENRPSSVLNSRLSAQAYLWHPYGRSVLGNRSEVENVPIDRLQDFYRRWYRPDNATVVVAGNFDPETTLAAVRRRFGTIAKPARPLPQNYTVEPPQDGEREITIRRAGDRTLIGVAYHTPAVTHPDSAALRVLDSVMGSMPSGRLNQELEKRGLSSSTASTFNEFQAPGLIGFFANAGPDTEPARVEAALLDLVENIAKRPVTEQEVRSAKLRIANIYDRANRTNVIGVANGLSDAIAAGDWRLWFQVRDAIDRVTAQDVNRVAATYLVAGNRTLARFVPTTPPVRVAIPQAPSADLLLKDYAGRPAPAPGEVFDTSRANIAARSRILTLGDGLKVGLLPKKSRGERVSVTMLFRFGDDRTLAPYRDVGTFAGNLLMQGGNGLTEEQIAERLVELNASVGITGSAGVIIASIDSTRSNLRPTLEFVAGLLRNPAFDKADFERMRSNFLVALESRRNQPGQVVDYQLRQYFDGEPKGSRDSVRSIDAEIAGMKAVTLQQVRNFHRDFYGTAQGEIGIAGDFDPDATVADLTRLFAGWKSGHPHVREVKPFFAPPKPVRWSFETPDKANAVLLAQAAVRISADHPDHPALMLAARVFGSGSATSRLGERIRQREGLSYYVAGGLIVPAMGENGLFYMQATSAPENMAQVETAMKEELVRFVRDGITPAELADAKANAMANRIDSRTTDPGLAEMLRSNLHLDRSIQRDIAFDKAIEALTVDQVNAAIRRHIRADDVSIAVAGDFKAAGQR